MKQSKTAIDAAGDRPEGKRGVAIVLVLGLLATLMLMAVAFSISMRIERRGAGNLRFTVQARHMLWAALANAINEINLDLDDGSNVELYPDWADDIKVSTANDPVISTSARLLSRDAIEYIPDDLREIARNADPKWRVVANGGGRYAYMAINKSGLLDASLVGDTTTNRWMGTDPGEIRIDRIPEIENAGTFSDTRNEAIRIETLPELRHLLDGKGLKDDSVESFETYSRAIGGERMEPDGKAAPMVNVGAKADWANMSMPGMRQAFMDSGLKAPQATLAALNVLDYADADSKPQVLNNACVERVPMINEIILAYQADFKPDKTVKTRLVVQIEWMYPFVTPPNSDFTMHYQLLVTPDPKNTDAVFVPNIPAVEIQKPSILGSGTAQPPVYGLVMPASPFQTSGAAAQTNATVKFKVKVAAYITGADGRVDEVPSPYDVTKGVELEIEIPKLAAGDKPQNVTAWAQVVDPRFNWDPAGGSGAQWLTNKKLPATFKETPLAINDVTRVFMDPTTFGLPAQSFDTDGSIEMHVADAPLQTVGELGHICYDQWNTIRLYDHKKPDRFGVSYHKVFDYFSTDRPGTPLYGRVNMNAINTNVLAAVFYQVPRWAIGTRAPERLTDWADARSIAAELIASGPYRNLSDICRVVDWGSYTAAGKPEIAREGLVRNSVGLLTVRQNYFTVIVKADAYSLAMGTQAKKGATLASVHAVADVWRDPYRDADNKHKTFIRYYRMLEE